jgi:hypothetical protein
MQPAHSSRGGRRSQRVRAYRVHGPRFAASGSADRSRPPERSAQAAGRRVREPGRPPAPRRVDTTADAGETATPPVRAPERDGDRRMSSFSSRSRTRRRSARSPASRCPLVLATAASAATATPRLKRRKHTPDLVLGASSHAAALGERQPMPSVEPEPECKDENGAGRRERPRARDSKRQQQGGAARRRRDSGSRQPLVLLAARVVQARPSPMRCSSCLPNHRGDAPTASGRSNDPPALAFDRPD